MHTKLSYGIGGVADNALYTLLGTFLLFFLTTVAGIRPATAGTIAALGSILEAVCGPIAGFLSDNAETRFGKRKPFLMVAAIPVAIVTMLLFTSIGASYGVKVAYYTMMTLLFWTAFATFFVPYLAWGSDLTDDYNERTTLRSYAYFFNQVGMAIGMVMPTIIVEFMMKHGSSVERSWSAVGLFVGVCSGAALLICSLNIKKNDVKDFKKDPNREKVFSAKKIAYMFSEYFQILKLKSIRFLILGSVVYLLCNTMFSAGRIYYFTFNIGLSAKQISFTMLLMTLVGIALVPVVGGLANYIDKKMVFIGGIALTGLVMLSSKFVGVDNFLEACILCAIYSVGNTCYWQLMPSMLYDVCEVEELASGEKHSGQVISLQALSESISTAVSLQVLGIILGQAGFNDMAATQPEAALTWIENCLTIVPGILLILVAISVWKYPVDRKSFPRILRAVERQRRGESIDLGEFGDIL